MTTGAATTTAPTTALLQMPTKNALAQTTVTLRTAATARRNNSQAVHAHDCTRRVYATYMLARRTTQNYSAKTQTSMPRLIWSSSATSNRGMKQGDDFKDLKRFVNFKLSCCDLTF